MVINVLGECFWHQLRLVLRGVLGSPRRRVEPGPGRAGPAPQWLHRGICGALGGGLYFSWSRKGLICILQVST